MHPSTSRYKHTFPPNFGAQVFLKRVTSHFGLRTSSREEAVGRGRGRVNPSPGYWGIGFSSLGSTRPEAKSLGGFKNDQKMKSVVRRVFVAPKRTQEGPKKDSKSFPRASQKRRRLLAPTQTYPNMTPQEIKLIPK